MPDVTPVEELPYPCLDDPFQRHWIQDLAEAADDSLFRIQSDVDYVTKKPKAQMRRLTGSQNVASGPAAAVATVTYTVVDYETVPGWSTAATGLIVPTESGIFYVDAMIQLDPATVADEQAYHFGIAYGGVQKLARKYNISAWPRPMKISGLVYAPGGSSFSAQLQVMNDNVASVNITVARLAVQWIARSHPPLNSNPWMEKTIVPWTGVNTVVSLSTAQAYRGNSSLLSTPSAISSTVLSEHVPVTVGTAYRASAWLRQGSASNNHRVEIHWYDGAMVDIGGAINGNTVATSTTWQLSSANGAAPVGAVTARLVMAHTGAAIVTTFMDDAQIHLA